MSRQAMYGVGRKREFGSGRDNHPKQPLNLQPGRMHKIGHPVGQPRKLFEALSHTSPENTSVVY